MLCVPFSLLTEHSVFFWCVERFSFLAGIHFPGEPGLHANLSALCVAGLSANGALGGGGLRARDISANPVSLSLSACGPPGCGTALGALWPPQLQLPRLLQSQLGAGQPSGECASVHCLLPFLTFCPLAASTGLDAGESEVLHIS